MKISIGWAMMQRLAKTAVGVVAMLSISTSIVSAAVTAPPGGDVVLPARFTMAATPPPWSRHHYHHHPGSVQPATAGLHGPGGVGARPRFDMSPYVGAE